jgi:hypothetical protein
MWSEGGESGDVEAFMKWKSFYFKLLVEYPCSMLAVNEPKQDAMIKKSWNVKRENDV